MKKARQNWRGFTLIEMLVVIVIIAILVALLFPAIKQAILKAEVAKAKTTILSIATAVKAFNSEYGYLPTVSSTDMKTSIFTNPRNITFLDTANKDLASDGVTILDPWKHAYQIAVDAAYAGSIANPLPGGTPATITSSVIVWSLGPDGVLGTSDDVTSWQ